MFDFGVRKSRKQRKRETLERNREQGKYAETMVRMRYELSGHEVEKVHTGADLRVRKRNPFTGRVISTRLVEVKSGNSRLSPLQERLKKKKRTKVERVNSRFW